MSDLAAPTDLAAEPRRTLLRAFGVEWNTTPTGWHFLPVHAAVGVAAALLALDGPLAERLALGLAAGLVITAVNLLHELGHVFSARLVGGPMREVLFHGTRPLTLYHDDADPPPRVHIGRAVGGPIMNIAVGAVLATLWASVPASGSGAFLLGWATIVSLAFGLGSLAPVPSVDGEVIWRELRRL